jgi:hypothetical protein
MAKTQKLGPLTQAQQNMMSSITGSLCTDLLTGDITPHEAADVLRRLITWLEELKPDEKVTD